MIEEVLGLGGSGRGIGMPWKGRQVEEESDDEAQELRGGFS